MASRHRITLANRGGLSYEVDDGSPLLDALEGHGVSLPYGCRYGGCISCAAKLLDGEVDQSEGVALNGRQVRDGYVYHPHSPNPSSLRRVMMGFFASITKREVI